MAFPEEILGAEPIGETPIRHEGFSMLRVQDSLVEPVTIDEIRQDLVFNSADTSQDARLLRIAKAVRRRIEKVTGVILIEQVWQQTMDQVGNTVELYRKPLIGVTSIKYITNTADDTELTWLSTSYGVAGNRVFARDSWPVHRGLASFTILFRAGKVALPAGSNDADKLAAQAQVEEHYKMAITQWTAAIFESSGGERSFEFEAQIKGAMPRNVQDLIAGDIDWRPW